MIEPLQSSDIDQVAAIWLEANSQAHSFIPVQYWQDNLELVKKMLLQATVYVSRNDQKILGFIGLIDDHIEGIFVTQEAQSQGIGKQLLDFVKVRHSLLSLNVYQKNTIHFYQREGFKIQATGRDEDTGEKDLLMTWQLKR